MSAPGPVAAVLAAAIAVLASAGCTTRPTEIVVAIEGPSTPLELVVTANGAEAAHESLPLDDGKTLPLTLTLVHGGGDYGPVDVAASARAPGGAVIASDCERVWFARESTVRVTLSLVPGTTVACADPVPDGGAVDGGDDEDAGVDAGPACDEAVCAAMNAVCAPDGRCRIVTCQGAFEDCEWEPDGNTCETNVNISEEHCGECGFPCPVGYTCMMGMCMP